MFLFICYLYNFYLLQTPNIFIIIVIDVDNYEKYRKLAIRSMNVSNISFKSWGKFRLLFLNVFV